MAARLSLAEREVIERRWLAGHTQAQIAQVLGRSPGTISRELRRGGGPRSGRPGARLVGRPARYRAGRAQARAVSRGRRPKPSKLTGALLSVITGWLEADWSPEQISAMLKQTYPGDDAMRVSHETIYRSLFVQSRGQLRKDLTAHLRSGRSYRKTQGSGRMRGRIPGMINISDRPAEVADRAVPGHWEGDLIIGAAGQGAVMTLVERASRFVLLAPIPGRRDSLTATGELTRLIATLPMQLRKSLTWDQGAEMSRHAQFTIDTGIPVYFCDPHSPWQRGTNENTNGLLRQYWPKGTDLSGVTRAETDAVALRLNTRPRKTLNWQTPAQALNTGPLATTS
ncbi:IS30 family transposase [Dermacoccaceae bacterium W4C1]